MLKRINGLDESGACVKISDASFPCPFASGLEYGSPARGAWNIVHTGMLIPESHQIYVCASNCLRGVVLTAAEMGAQDRFSTVTIKENNILDGDMENLIIEGVTDILTRLEHKPRAVLLYTSCVHHFIGCDLPLCYSELRKRFPEIDFTDCYMNPIMRKSGLTPDQLMRKQLYSLLKEEKIDKSSVNIIGNNLATDCDSDIVQLIKKSGCKLKEITDFSDYEGYQTMAQSFLNISYNPVAVAGGKELEKRLKQMHLYLPLSYSKAEIQSNMSRLAEVLGVEYDGGTELFEKSEKALAELKNTIGDIPISIDYTATMFPLSLARLLLEHGFNVERIYADSFGSSEKDDFLWIKENHPDVLLYATVQIKMRVLERKTESKMLCIGQKAAYFTGSRNFVNIVEGGGFYGFVGISKLCGLIREAYFTDRDASDYIQQKGLGCECCL